MIRLENISFDHCIKCTICTVYCPIARATDLFPGPKISGPDTERLRIKNPEFIDDSLKYCNNCKRCEIACPSDVKIADIIQTAKWKYFRKKIRFRDFFLSRTDLIGQLAVRANRAAAILFRNSVIKFIMGRLLKVSSNIEYPNYEKGSFQKWYNARVPDQKGYGEKVIYFHGCYVNYNNHGLGRDVIDVLNAMGVGVLITKEKCCGVPLISSGYLLKAKGNALYNINALTSAVDGRGLKIIFSSSSCSFAIKHEYPNFLKMDTSKIAGKLQYITEFIYDRFEKGIYPRMKPVNIRAAYHPPCHLERIGGIIHTIGVLRKIPGLELILLHSECCGLSGTYGFKRENSKISRGVGAELFRRIKEVKPDLVITDCESCKWQIEANTPFEVLHPVSILAGALKNNKFRLS